MNQEQIVAALRERLQSVQRSEPGYYSSSDYWDGYETRKRDEEHFLIGLLTDILE